MFRLSGKAKVGRKPADVSAFLADVANEPKWQKEIIHVQLTAGIAGTPGAKHERVQVVGGRNIKTVNELTEHVPGERVVYRAAGKVIEYTLEYVVTGSGPSSDVEMKFEGEMLGFAGMFEGIAADELRGAIQGNFERLAKILDG
ncbi:MAG TPA: SRPBCC family protein [Candidatus Thermoplasmatota archaeon]